MSSSAPHPPPTGPVLLFDGECGLCRAVVRTLLRLDRRALLRYAPLQGPFGQAALARLGLPTEDFDSLVFLPEATGPAYALRTAGVLSVLRLLGGPYRALAALLGWLPADLRDRAYYALARIRHRILGRRSLATPLETEPRHRERFFA